MKCKPPLQSVHVPCRSGQSKCCAAPAIRFAIISPRNPDDEVCARYHVPELFTREREQLLGVVDLYRYDPTTHSEVVPVLGNKGAGKTHLLHSIKHGTENAWQLLVTPGTYQKDSEFLEYLLFQVIDTLLGGGKQKGTRPLEFVGEELVSGLLRSAPRGPDAAGATRSLPRCRDWAAGRAGSVSAATQAQERTQWLFEQLSSPPALSEQSTIDQSTIDNHPCLRGSRR